MTTYLYRGQLQSDLIPKWVQIATRNDTIKHDSPAPLAEHTIYISISADDFIQFITSRQSHPIGTAICIDDVCFVQQSEDGDNWLVIKEQYAFDSFPLQELARCSDMPAFLRRLHLMDLKTLEHYWATDKQRQLHFGDFPSLIREAAHA